MQTISGKNSSMSGYPVRRMSSSHSNGHHGSSSSSSTDAISVDVEAKENLYRDKDRKILRLKQGQRMSFRVNSATTLKTLMNAYCSHQRIKRESAEFMFAGERIKKDNETVQTLCLNDQDTIYVKHSDKWSRHMYPPSEPSRLAGDMRRLFFDVNGSRGGLEEAFPPPDITFLVGPNEDTFRAHKAIVCSRSEKMKAMFADHTLEGKNGEAHIPDHKPEVFDLMLEFLYTGDFDSSKLYGDDSRSVSLSPGRTSRNYESPSTSSRGKGSNQRGRRKRRTDGVHSTFRLSGSSSNRSSSTTSSSGGLSVDISDEDKPGRLYHCDRPLQLLALADEYLLTRLKHMVETYLIYNCIDMEQIVACLRGADKFRAQFLKRQCVQYVLDNYCIIKETSQSVAELKSCSKSLILELLDEQHERHKKKRKMRSVKEESDSDSM